MRQRAPLPNLELLGAVLLLAVLADPAGAGPPPPVSVVEATPALLGGRLRVHGRPGDPALRSSHVTAVVRKTDGWLVDFWPAKPALPSAPQLKDLRAIDGLWLLHPILHVGEGHINLTAQDVRAAGEEIETASKVHVAGATLRVVTRYRLDAAAPRMIITTRFEHVAGGRVLLMPGDMVKWGNVDYYIDGVGRAPDTFHGSGAWIGRKGASGDLVLRTLGSEPMRIDYQMRHYGLAPEIRTRYARKRLLPGETIVVQRTLAYEALPPVKAAVRPTGSVELDVRDEADKPIAFKLSLRGQKGTPDPDFGNDGDETGAGRFAWSGNGQLSVALPPGKYKLLASAGFERDVAEWPIEIAAGARLRLAGRLPRVIQSPGVIAADLHLHQAPSVDADIACSTRIISVAAEGVELAVSSDHYTAFDLGPTARRLYESGALVTKVATMLGTEVSTVGNNFGHFNLFPVPADVEVAYENTTPRKLFADMRRAAPGALLQVNHPRLHDLGYFHRYELDPKSGRVPARQAAEYDPSFDTLEVFNGLEAWTMAKTRLVLFDWIHLLGLGHRYTATGSSDSHKLFFSDPGLPRTLIRYGTAADDAADVAADPSAILAALRAGRAVVSSGPVIDAEVASVGPGGTASGGGPLRALRIRVRAAPWVDVSDIEVLLGGTAHRLRWINVAPTSAVERYSGVVQVPVRSKTFVVVVAMGRRDLPNVYTPNVKPFAFTNPIWLEP
jgi:hypothetical protein